MSQDISQQKDWLSAWRTFYEPEKSLEKVDPNAISISSVDSDGMPNNRIVLLKDVNEDGFIFYTNYQSQKGKELFANGKGAITWWSRAQHKSVRVQGLVSKVDNKLGRLNFNGSVEQANNEGDKDLSLQKGTLGTALEHSLAKTHLLSAAAVRDAIRTIDISLDEITEDRVNVGAILNRLEHKSLALSRKTIDLLGIHMRLTSTDALSALAP